MKDIKYLILVLLKVSIKRMVIIHLKWDLGAKVYEYIGTYDLIINRYLYYFAKFIVKINE